MRGSWNLLWLGLLVGCNGTKPVDDSTVDVLDGDGDGYSAPEDCDDAEPTTHPGAVDVPYDDIDSDCAGDDDFDQDRDGFRSEDYGGDDCDDVEAVVNPSAVESCDTLDNNCDGVVDEGLTETFYQDGDGDGFGDAAFPAEFCELPAGYVENNTDCNDGDGRYHPDAEDDCSTPIDYNCDGAIGKDSDNDGYSTCTDCADGDASIHPGAVEVCDGVDQDCDNEIDDGIQQGSTWYVDLDEDGYGDANDTIIACGAQGVYSATVGGDCADEDATSYPGATEACDGVDNNCDGQVDDGAPTATWYADQDGDGFGEAGSFLDACAAPAGYVADGSDCDDSTTSSYPGATELCDGLDNDCNGAVDDGGTNPQTWYTDGDGDGYGTGAGTVACTPPTGTVAVAGDCDDADSGSAPGLSERCDGVDNDCSGVVDDNPTDGSVWYLDGDGDGYGAGASLVSCSAPSGAVADGSDCDDTSAALSPGLVEVCDGLDNDCSGAVDDAAVDAAPWYDDVDGDGYGGASTVTCTQPAGTISAGGDCDDADVAVNPAAVEVCDGKDQDCNGAVDDAAVDAVSFYADADADGFGDAAVSVWDCSVPVGFVSDDTDCDDVDAGIFPSAAEQDDGLDQDCDGSVDEDFVSPGDIVITEVTRQPYVNGTATNNDASWFEIYNNSLRDVDLSGWYIGRVSPGVAEKGIYVDPSTPVILSPGSYATFCKTDNYETPQAGMGNIPFPLSCDYVWGETTDSYHSTTLNLQRDEDRIFLYVGGSSSTGTLIDEVHWTYDVTAGYWPRQSQASMSLDPAHLNATDNDDLSYWCFTTESSTGTFGKTGSYRWWDDVSKATDEYGTPTAVNYDCPNVN